MFPSFKRKKNRLDHESFYQSNIEILLHLSPDDCKNELKRLKITSKEDTNRKLAKFQIFPDSAHQADFDRYQGHMKLGEKFSYFFHSTNTFFESISYEEVNPEQIRQINYKFRNIHNIENKLTRFQIYPETELAYKYKKPVYKTQYSEIFVEFEKSFDMNTGKIIINPHGKHYSTSDENSYIPVQLLKNRGNWEK